MIGHPLPRLAAPVMDAAQKLLDHLRAREAHALAIYQAAARGELPPDQSAAEFCGLEWSALDIAQRDRQAVEALIEWAGEQPVEAPIVADRLGPGDELRLLSALDRDAQRGLADLEAELAERHRYWADQARMPMLNSYTPGAITAAANQAREDCARAERQIAALNRLKTLAHASVSAREAT